MGSARRVEVECPYCSARQVEPAAIVSTYCRSCGKHIRVGRDRKTRVDPESRRLKQFSPRDAWAAAPEGPGPAADARPEGELGQAPGREETVSRLVPPALSPAGVPKPDGEPAPLFGRVTERSNRNEDSANLERFRASRSRIRNPRRSEKVRCFSCLTTFETLLSAKTADCPDCGAPVNLGDFEISKPCRENISTHGQVTINRSGTLHCDRVEASSLKIFGEFLGEIECREDVIVKGIVRVTGDLRCVRLEIGKDAQVEVKGVVECPSVSVDGSLLARELVTKSLVIGSFGSVEAPVKTRSLRTDDGGMLNGVLEIIRAKAVVGG
ncbi:MAG TPA: polymer-forming cytoskeletal protein [Verrucomicrobiales bacterium]|nr:polymer-forming cytoskeletal protein [Verrucomicrobiales bacterium]